MTKSIRTGPWAMWLAASVASIAGAAGAADLRVAVAGVRSQTGQVLVALCSAERFLGEGCERSGSAPARAGVTQVVLEDVPEGVFALQAIYDENGNRVVDRSILGLPREGIGFSRDAPMRRGSPRFADAAVSVRAAGGATELRLRYFGQR